MGRVDESDWDVWVEGNTVVVEHPLSDALHGAVVRGARTAAASGVTDWHVVAEHERKAIAVARELPGVETAVFADEREARARAA